MSSRDKTVFQLASAILLEVSLSLKAPLPRIFKILFKTISTKWRHFFKILFSHIIKSYCNFIKTEQLNTFDNLQLNSMGAHNSSESTESIVHALTLLSRKQEEYTDYRNIRSLKVLNCGDITWSRQSNTRQQHTHTHTYLTALCLGLPGWAGTRKVKPIWILLKQQTVSGSGISWDICTSAPCSRQITTPAPHHSVFYRPDALPAAQPTASKHWRQTPDSKLNNNCKKQK